MLRFRADRQIQRALTTGAIRYRLDFAAKGHQRAAVRLVDIHGSGRE